MALVYYQGVICLDTLSFRDYIVTWSGLSEHLCIFREGFALMQCQLETTLSHGVICQGTCILSS